MNWKRNQERYRMKRDCEKKLVLIIRAYLRVKTKSFRFCGRSSFISEVFAIAAVVTVVVVLLLCCYCCCSFFRRGSEGNVGVKNHLLYFVLVFEVVYHLATPQDLFLLSNASIVIYWILEIVVCLRVTLLLAKKCCPISQDDHFANHKQLGSCDSVAYTLKSMREKPPNGVCQSGEIKK